VPRLAATSTETIPRPIDQASIFSSTVMFATA
jgi:hypothetical protein